MFPNEVCIAINNYVYRLIDPRNGETFYVGRGVGNRVFTHIQAEIENPTPSDKVRRIREIQSAGFTVSHVIHRHNLDLATAREVEAALIDAYPGLSNIIDGAGSEFGCMHASEIINKYQLEIANITHNALILKVNRTYLDMSLYDSVRFAWSLNIDRARQVDYVLAVVHGVIRGVFKPTEWLPATAENFPGKETLNDKIGFYGEEAEEIVLNQYVGKKIPEQFVGRNYQRYVDPNE